MIRLREIVRSVLRVLGLARESKTQAEDSCIVCDCWGEMANRIRKDAKS
jgi:hypothetical protein